MAIVVSSNDDADGRHGSARPAAAARSGSNTNKQRMRKSRDPPSPRPILDRRLLLKYLDASSDASANAADGGTTGGNIALTAKQVDVFYQQLHRANYPPLPTLARSLLRQEGCRKRRNTNGNNGNGGAGLGGDGRSNDEEQDGGGDVVDIKTELPQLPRNFLLFLLHDGDDGHGETDTNKSQFVTLTSAVKCARTSRDGSTTKLAVTLQDGHVVETVLMRHDDSRVTVCVSSQVGCAMGCTFCATGTMGIRGDLTAGEILEQLVHAQRVLDANGDGGGAPPAGAAGKNKLGRIRNVVFMGMGEPLNNYRNVVEACRALISKRTWNLAHRHVTVSTVGVVNRMRDLTRDLPEVSLALSLHAPNQEMRSAIVPTAKHYPIEELIDALDDHMMAKNSSHGRRRDGVKKQKKKMGTKKSNVTKAETYGVDRVEPGTNSGPSAMTSTDQGGNVNAENDDEVARRKSAGKKKKAMIEYVMLEGDTSTVECAHQLGKLCENRYVVVNLIPYNKTNVKDQLSCPPPERIAEFQRIVSSYGCYCFVRRTMGSDIAGACGQLVVDGDGDGAGTGTDRGGAAAVDIEDGPFGRRRRGGAAVKTTTGDGDGRRGRGRVVSFPADLRRGSTTAAVSPPPDGGDAGGRDRPRVGEGLPARAADDGITRRRRGDDVGSDGDYFSRRVRPLAAATAISASCFVVSTAIFLARRKGR